MAEVPDTREGGAAEIRSWHIPHKQSLHSVMYSIMWLDIDSQWGGVIRWYWVLPTDGTLGDKVSKVVLEA